MDVPAGVTQGKGNTGFSIHFLSAVLALILVKTIISYREKPTFVPPCRDTKQNRDKSHDEPAYSSVLLQWV